MHKQIIMNKKKVEMKCLVELLCGKTNWRPSIHVRTKHSIEQATEECDGFPYSTEYIC